MSRLISFPLKVVLAVAILGLMAAAFGTYSDDAEAGALLTNNDLATTFGGAVEGKGAKKGPDDSWSCNGYMACDGCGGSCGSAEEGQDATLGTTQSADNGSAVQSQNVLCSLTFTCVAEPDELDSWCSVEDYGSCEGGHPGDRCKTCSGVNGGNDSYASSSTASDP
jgi:hypothetical protein